MTATKISLNTSTPVLQHDHQEHKINCHWLKGGDRSHCNLQKLDSLSLSYPGWKVDFEEAEEAHMKGGYDFDCKLFKLKESQRVYVDGNRTHQRLVLLDSLQNSLSYPGWEKDVRHAERYHITSGEGYCADLSFAGRVDAIKNKEKLHKGDRSHKDLQQLDALRASLTYPDWKVDIEHGETLHRKGMSLEDTIHQIKEKQNIHTGCRSHPRLKALDALHLTYAGWEADKQNAEKFHLQHRANSFSNSHFNDLIDGMKNKQHMLMGDRSHRHLQQLDQLKPSLSYPGWEGDFRYAEIVHQRGMEIAFQDALHKLQQKQCLHMGDRSHRRLIQLDSLKASLCYPGWKEDVQDAELCHVSYMDGIFSASVFGQKLESMKNKQRVFQGYEQQHENESNNTSNDYNISNGNFHTNNNDSSRCRNRGEMGTNTCPTSSATTARNNNNNNNNANDNSNAISTNCTATCLQTGTDASPKVGLCVVCLEQEKSYAFVPCGHLALCETCKSSKSMKQRRRFPIRCPICRRRSDKIMKIYL